MTPILANRKAFGLPPARSDCKATPAAMGENGESISYQRRSCGGHQRRRERLTPYHRNASLPPRTAPTRTKSTASPSCPPANATTNPATMHPRAPSVRTLSSSTALPSREQKRRMLSGGAPRTPGLGGVPAALAARHTHPDGFKQPCGGQQGTCHRAPVRPLLQTRQRPQPVKGQGRQWRAD
jgi:hypothetical protein